MELGAKILDEDGAMAGAESFRASAPVGADTAAAAAAALDEAFRQVATNIVIWTLGVI